MTITVVTVLLLAMAVALIVGFMLPRTELRVVKAAEAPVNMTDPGRLDDLEIIPKYPGAILAEDVLDDYTWRRVKFKVPADIATMYSFYTDALTKNGWAKVSQDMYTWSDPQKVYPWNLDVYLGGEAFEDGTSGVTLIISRWSTSDKLPVYPGTAEFKLGTLEDKGSKADILTYETAATLSGITAFYKEKLPIYGWKLVDTKESKDPASSALLFTSSRRDANNATIQMWLSVQASFGQKGDIYVEMRTATRQFDWGNSKSDAESAGV